MRSCLNSRPCSLVIAEMKNRFLLFWYKLINADLWPARLYIALSSLLWSLLLFWPSSTFESQTYTLMFHFASKTTWAVMFGFVGLFGLVTLFYDLRNRAALFFDAAFSCVLWTGSCVAILLSVYPAPAAISAEITTAMLSWWILATYPLQREKYEPVNIGN